MSMNTIRLLTNIAERQIIGAQIFEQNIEENEDDLLQRLGRDTRLYGLHNNERLDIASLSDEVCLSLFRFTYDEIQRIVYAMELPGEIYVRRNTRQQSSYSSVEAFAICLRRLAYPARFTDLQLLFGLSYSTICTIFNEMIAIIYEKYKDGIRYNKYHMNLFNLRRFSDAITRKGSCYPEVVGFIDGAINAICRTVELQESVYNGHVRFHGLKYQGIVTPDGITISLCGPFAGAIHDQRMLDSSDILEEMKEQLDCTEADGPFYAIYGDPAYRETEGIIRPLGNSSSNEDIAALNKMMSSVRICVEWEFGHVANLFAFLKFKPGQKLLLSRVGQFYAVATLMKNIHVCIRRGNKTSKYFNIRPPTLEQYLTEISPEESSNSE